MSAEANGHGDTLKRTSKLDAVQREESLFHWFATNTSFLGFNRLVGRVQKFRKIVWLVAIIICFSVATGIVCERVVKYFQYETVTETKSYFRKQLEFPAITICNANMIRKSRMTGGSQESIIDQPMIAGMPNLDDETTDEMMSPGSTAETSEIEDTNTRQLKQRCSFVKCESGEINCPTYSGSCCLPTRYICNNYKECWDGSDESGCSTDRSVKLKKRSTKTNIPSTGGINSTDDDSNNMNTITSNTNSISNSTENGMAGGDGNKPMVSSFQNIEVDGWQLVDRYNIQLDRNTDLNKWAEEITLLECHFRRDMCNASWFKQSITTMGSCWTFNHKGLEENTTPEVPLYQRVAGPYQGLRMLMNIQKMPLHFKYEYTSSLPDIGAKVVIHPKDEMPDISKDGIYLPTGMRADIRLSYIKIENHDKPWGDCDGDRKLRLSDAPYTMKLCLDECRLSMSLEQCGCKPYFFASYSHPACNDSQWYGCALPLLEEIDGEFDKYCECPISCNEVRYSPRVSYIKLTDDYNVVDHMNERFYGSKQVHQRSQTQFYRENAVGLQLYFDSMMVTEIKEVKAMDLISLLSEIGGQLGLFVGVSILTLCEVIETVYMAYITRRSGMRSS